MAPAPAPAEEIAEEPGDGYGEQEGQEGPSEDTQATNEVMIESLCIVLNKVLTTLTKMDEIALDEDEVETLKRVWKPILPEVSPAAAAITATALIVAGKLAIYYDLKKERQHVSAESKAAQASQLAASKVSAKPDAEALG